jgi:hypothetical protein
MRGKKSATSTTTDPCTGKSLTDVMYSIHTVRMLNSSRYKFLATFKIHT